MAALRMLVRVQEYCEVAMARSSCYKVYVHLNDLASWAADAGTATGAGDFSKAKFEVRSEDVGEIRAFNIQVIRPQSTSAKRGSDSRSGVCCSIFRCLAFSVHVLLLGGAVGGAAFIYYSPDLASPYLEKVGMEDQYESVTMVLIVFAVVLLMMLALWCCRRRFGECFLVNGCCGSEPEEPRTCCPSSSGCCSLPFGSRAGTLVCGYSRLETDLI